MANLVNLLAVNEDGQQPEEAKEGGEDDDDEFSMSISYDYGERDYEYGDPFADQRRGWRKDSQEEKDREIEEILNRPPREDIDIIP